jgi:ferredoxin-NADP reductase
VLECGGRTNAYSLTGSGDAPEEYSISVLHRPDGRGGSSAVHRLLAGERVLASRPRSAFAPAATARRHLLIAGGIGITPMVSHLRAALDWNRPAELLYSYRPGGAAHLDEVRRLCSASPALALAEFSGRRAFREGLAQALRRQPLGTHLYVCGPQGFMDLVLSEARAACWPESRLHLEAFGAAEPASGEPFTARLARSGRTLPVPSGTSLLEALEQAGHPVPNLCRQGVCGECVLPVKGGRPQHRDLFLAPAEKAANNAIMCCVSRSQDPELELDL